MSFVHYAIETSTNFLYHIEQKRDVYDRYGKEGLTGGKTKFDRSDLVMVKVILRTSCFLVRACCHLLCTGAVIPPVRMKY